MARKTEAAAPAADETQQTETTQPQVPRPAQGITIRYMNTGDRKKDVHPFFDQVRKIDPESLVVDGEPPYLRLPIHGTSRVAIKQVDAVTAAELLACDKATGASSTYSLASDAEIATFKAETAKRIAAEKKAK